MQEQQHENVNTDQCQGRKDPAK